MSRGDLTEAEWHVLKDLLPIEPENRCRLVFDDFPAFGMGKFFPLRLGFVARCEADRQGPRDEHVAVAKIGVLSGGAENVVPLLFQ